MTGVFFKRRYWVILLVLIGIVLVGLIIISGYSPSKNKMSETAKICADSTKAEACKEALLSLEIWGVKKWAKTFGDPSYYDVASSVQQTSDGGFIIIGTTGRNASNFTRCASTYLIKTDADGNKVWEDIFGADECISGKSAQQTLDRGYIITGVISKPSNIYLSKRDTDGNIIWGKSYRAGDTDEWGWGWTVQQTADGGYMILGVVLVSSNPHIYLLKIDTNGNMQWNKTFGEYYSEIGYSIQQTSDGGYIVTADTRRGIKGNEGDIHLIKTDADGNTVWDKLIDPLGQHENDYPLDAKQTSDGGFIIIEYTEDESGTGLGDTYLLKIDPDGNRDWRKILDGFKGYLIDIASDRGYMITGVNGNGYLIKMKTDTDGNVLWTKAIEENFSGMVSSMYYSIQQTSDGGYLVYINQESGVWGSGHMNTDIVLVKIDETSTPRPPIEVSSTISTNPPTLSAENTSVTGKGWNKTFGGAFDTKVNSVRQTSDGGYIVAGYVDYGLTVPKDRNGTQILGTQIIPQWTAYLLKTDAYGNIVWNKSFGGLSTSNCPGFDNPLCTLNWNRSYGGLTNTMGNSARQTSDGGYIVVGFYDNAKLHNKTYDRDYKDLDGATGGRELYLIKTDANGNMQWDKMFGGENYQEIGHYVQQTSDGGYFIIGATNSYRICLKCENPLLRAPVDLYLIKTDADGNKVWSKTIGDIYIDDMDMDDFPAVQPTSDGGYIALGMAAAPFIDNGTIDAYLLKIDANGNKSWGKTISMNGEGKFLSIRSVQQVSDGGYIIGLTEEANLTGRENRIIKTDANGNILWDKASKWEEDKSPFTYSVQQTSDGGYVTVGMIEIPSTSHSPYYSTYLTKSDAYGNKVWERRFYNQEDIRMRSVQQTSDGGYIISTGISLDKAFWVQDHQIFNIYLIKTDENGNI